VGVTDYLDINNYLAVRKLHVEGKLPNIALVIPNIEFRVLPATGKNPGANVHLIVDPSAEDHPERIRHALTMLTYRYDGNDYACTRDHLAALGRAVHGSTLDASAAFFKGVEQFRPDVERFLKWWQGQDWLRSNSLVGVVAGGDGLSGWSMGGGLQATREELARLGHFIFSGRDGEIDFWLLRKDGMDVPYAKKLGAPKPCVHGSDAHSVAKLFKPDLSRFCWIKADPTFTGLRQVIFEPELRVYIGPTPPEPVDRSRIIESIEIQDPNSWFGTEKLLLNSGLVAVIGQKGSGKSALAELCALASGAWTSEDRAFLTRAGNEIEGLKIRLRWLDGRDASFTLGTDDEIDYPEVRYLSQSFVEKLCAGEDSSSEPLIREIESVVFENLAEADRLGFASFRELRAARTEGFAATQAAVRRRLDNLISEEKRLRANRASLSDKERRRTALRKEIGDLRKQLPTTKADKQAEAIKKLQEIQARIAGLESEEAKDKRTITAISALRSKVEGFRRDMSEFAAEARRQGEVIGLPSSTLANFEPRFRGDVEAPLTAREADLNARVSERHGSVKNPAPHTLAALRQEMATLQNQLAGDKAKRERLIRQTTRIAELEKEGDRLLTEIEDIKGSQLARLQHIRQERLALYEEIWKAIALEREALKALYSPVTTEGESLEFSVDITVDVEGWLARGLDMFDRRKTVPFASPENLRKKCLFEWKAAWQSADPVRARGVVEALLAELRRMTEERLYELRSGYSSSDLLEWVLGTEHIALNYGLRHNGVELRKLSPGTKGIVLLMVYLGIDRSDTAPLIIDQPEENLDNESIYGHLVRYFREAKRRRQVVLITHNPNLVVNTDADQVIVASNQRQENDRPLITYFSGSLEHSQPDGIREQVCKILEGGEEAFQKRERRYLLRRDSPEHVNDFETVRVRIYCRTSEPAGTARPAESS
jgi:energy-coupling factor transporter ATP-binding protein EcfA2